MKKLVVFYLLFLLIFPASSLAANRTLPDEILETFQTPEWEGYVIPTTSAGNPYEGSLASYYCDEYNHSDAFVILKKDDVNVLCVLGKEHKTWVILLQTQMAIKQGDDMPFISSEEYDVFYISYPRTDGQPYIRMTIKKLENHWLVTKVIYFPDKEYLKVEIYDNELRYAGDETNWEPVVVEGHIENSLELFNLKDFPLSIEAAQELFSGDGSESCE